MEGQNQDRTGQKGNQQSERGQQKSPRYAEHEEKLLTEGSTINRRATTKKTQRAIITTVDQEVDRE